MEQAHRDQRAAHLRAQRRARDAHAAAGRPHSRRGRRRSQRGSCEAGAGQCWWVWLMFPLIFAGPAIFDDFNPAALWSGFWGALLAPLSPLVNGFAGLMGMGADEAAFLLFAALLVNGAALAFALRRRGHGRA